MKKNNVNFLFLLIAALTVGYSLLGLGYSAAFFFSVSFYVIHAILFTDHIYYSPKCDYQFNFNGALFFQGKLERHDFSLLKPLPTIIDTCILPVNIKSTWLGFLFDPYIELRVDDVISRQYFERGTNGKRFLNLSQLKTVLQHENNSIKILGKYCRIKSGELTLSGFENANYQALRVLIISPHADDAELAAFAFYKHAESPLIVTISAGEVDAKQYETIVGRNNKEAAGLLKGRLRAWDSIAVPLWAGPHVQSIHLGYFCMTLKAMFEQPNAIITSHETSSADIRQFRTLKNNNFTIKNNENHIDNSWINLIADLTAIINEYQPDVIVTPHPAIDPQPDHLYATRATIDACDAAYINPTFLLYANHYQHTDMYPFGLEHSDIPLPPHFDGEIIAEKLYCFSLSNKDQLDKVCALKIMHDLNRPIAFKKRIRRLLQRIVGRSKMPYGDDDYLRKAIRQQELFWVTTLENIKRMLI